MKFNVKTTIELPDEEILGFVNEDQMYYNLEGFESAEEIPFELIIRSVSILIEDILFDLEPNDFDITKAE